MVDLNKNFLTANPSLLSRLQDDDEVSGYDYNRIVDTLNGNNLGTTYIGHNDTWVNTENIDPANGFNGRLFYVIPSNMISIQEALLSFKFLNYRTYSTITLSTTGNNAAAESGHSHSHNHTITLASNGGFGTILGMFIPSSGSQVASGQTAGTNDGGNTLSVNAAGSSGHTHNHNHSISGSTVVGISEDTSPANLTVLFDGVDQTTALGGPFNSDVVELNITPFINQTKGAWHKIEFGGTQRGQLQMHLRLNLLVVTPS